MQKLLCLTLLVIAASSCVSVPNTRIYTVAGQLDAGMIGAETNTDWTGDLTLEETITFLEPFLGNDEHPARAGAICMSAYDWNRMKTALEQACRAMGKKCKYETGQQH